MAFFLIINSGSGLIGHADGLHLFFLAIILWLYICGMFVSEESCVRVFYFV